MSFSVPVNLIRQWRYCPRVVYYQEMLSGHAVSRPQWVEQGQRFHEKECQLWRRRNLSRFGLREGKMHHHLSLKSRKLGMHGIADMAIETKDAVYAVEFKLLAHKKNQGSILQLCAYAMLLEEYFSKPSSTGFLVGQGKILHTVTVDAGQRAKVSEIVCAIDTMLEQGRKPDSSASLAQCCNCEYINYCNDR